MGNKAEEQKETPFFGFVGMMAAWLGMRYWKWVRGGGGGDRASKPKRGPDFFWEGGRGSIQGLVPIRQPVTVEIDRKRPKGVGIPRKGIPV